MPSIDRTQWSTQLVLPQSPKLTPDGTTRLLLQGTDSVPIWSPVSFLDSKRLPIRQSTMANLKSLRAHGGLTEIDHLRLHLSRGYKMNSHFISQSALNIHCNLWKIDLGSQTLQKDLINLTFKVFNNRDKETQIQIKSEIRPSLSPRRRPFSS